MAMEKPKGVMTYDHTQVVKYYQSRGYDWNNIENALIQGGSGTQPGDYDVYERTPDAHGTLLGIMHDDLGETFGIYYDE